MNSLQKCLFTALLAATILLEPLQLQSENVFSVDETANSIVHNRSGTAFPAKFDGFVRLEPHVLDQQGSQIAVGYSNRESVRAEFTEYVRLRNIDIVKYYIDSKSAISSNWCLQRYLAISLNSF